MTQHTPSPERVKAIFDQAAELAREDRAAFLGRACAGDAALRARVESLLGALDEASGFLKTGAADAHEAPTSDVAPTTTHSPRALEGPGQVIGPYKLLQQVGEGGFGSVFMAEQDHPVRRRVALKIIKLGMDTRSVIARFEAERQALALMDHPHIAKVLDAGATDSGRPYFVMELVRGDPITKYADANNLSIPERLELMVQVCNAVQHAHQKGIIHRDLKPSNVLVSTQDGRAFAKVIDFGIAKATSDRLTDKTLFTELRAMIGTPEYMSPEQAAGSIDIDTRTDVYSLGVLLYELLTGSPPFDSKRLRSAAYEEMQRIIREVEPPKPSTRLAQTPQGAPRASVGLGEAFAPSERTDTDARTGARPEPSARAEGSLSDLNTIARHRDTEPRKLGALVRGELDWIVMKCLDKDRARRYDTATGLGVELLRYLKGEAVTAAPPSAAYRVRKFVRRNKGPALAGVIIGAALLAGIIGTSSAMITAEREKSRALRQRDIVKKALDQIAVDSKEVAGVLDESWQKDHANGQGEPMPADEREFHRLADLAVQVVKSLDSAIRTGIFQRLAADQAREAEAAAKSEAIARAAEAQRDRDAAERARRRAEDINAFVTRILRLGDPATGGNQNTTIAQAMDTAIKEIDAGAFKDDPETEAALRATIASILQHNGRMKEADPVASRVLERARSVLNGDLQNAPVTRAAAMEMWKRFWKADPDASFNRESIIRTPGAMDLMAKAEPLLVEALEAARREHPGDHEDVATSLTQLASLRSALGRPAEAEPLLVEALAMERRLFAGDHQQVVGSLAFLANVREDLGRTAEAEPLLIEALEMQRRLKKGDNDGETVLLNELAYVRLTLGRAAEAEPLLVEALEKDRRLFKGDHLAVAISLSNLSRARQALGKTTEARQGFNDAIAMLRRLSPTGSPDLARVLWRSATARVDTGDVAAALPEIQEAVAMAEKLLAPENSQLKEYRKALAECKAALSKE